MQIRDAGEDDLPGILEIYNDAVRHSTAIWNDQPVDLENRRNWLNSQRDKDYPVLVAANDERVLGYAAYFAWRPHDGFRNTVENSVYVRDGERGAGIGRQLMQRLIEHARETDRHVMVAAIESGNRDSIHLHQQLGFIHVGQLREVGQKFGRWLDLTFMQLNLAPARRSAR